MIVVGIVLRPNPNEPQGWAPTVVGVWSDTRSAKAALRGMVEARKISPVERVWFQTASAPGTSGV